MFRTIAVTVVLTAALVGPARADVNKFNTDGRYLESGASSSEALTVKGKFNTRSDKLKGKVKCDKGCPIRGRLNAACEVGEGFYFVCQGKIGRKCRVDGILYQHGFEGSYTCGDRTGLWLFGNP